MKLWYLTQSDESGYDTYDSCIVAANSEVEAKQFHPGGATGWKYSGRSWAKSPDTVDAVVIGTAIKGTKAGVVLASFNAG